MPSLYQHCQFRFHTTAWQSFPRNKNIHNQHAAVFKGRGDAFKTVQRTLKTINYAKRTVWNKNGIVFFGKRKAFQFSIVKLRLFASLNKFTVADIKLLC